MSVSRSASSMQDATLIAFHEVVQKFGYWIHSGNQQMISGTGDVEQVPLGVVDSCKSALSPTVSMRSCKGIISSSQAITTAAQTPNPLLGGWGWSKPCPWWF